MKRLLSFGLINERIFKMNRIKLSNLAGLILIFLASGCTSDGPWAKLEQNQISDYIKTKPDSAYVLKPSGLYYFELHAGPGK